MVALASEKKCSLLFAVSDGEYVAVYGKIMYLDRNSSHLGGAGSSAA